MFEVEYIEDIVVADGNKLAVFQVIAVESSDPSMALSVAMGQDLVVDDIGEVTEATIVQHFRSQLDTSKRQIIVVELHSFPLIQAHIDSRNQYTVNPDYLMDRFSKDIVELWQGYDQTSEIPVINTNPEIGSCILKRHTLTTGKSKHVSTV